MPGAALGEHVDEDDAEGPDVVRGIEVHFGGGVFADAFCAW